MENRIQLNEVFEYNFEFYQEDVIAFAEATGDKNPIHLDEEYAKNSPFKRRILHGFLGGSVFSKVFGTLFPGEGTIYLKQNMSFYKPMFTNEKYTAVFTIIEIYPLKNRALVKTEIINIAKEIVTSGEALISHKSIK
jgi:3-hydroxybutyryl-CoA dehydratase